MSRLRQQPDEGTQRRRKLMYTVTGILLGIAVILAIVVLIFPQFR